MDVVYVVGFTVGFPHYLGFPPVALWTKWRISDDPKGADFTSVGHETAGPGLLWFTVFIDIHSMVYYVYL